MTGAFAATLAALGFGGAFVAGLVGVGGAIVMIPLLYYVPPWLGVGALDVKHVSGITMAQVFAVAAVGAAVHGGAGALHRPLALVSGTSMAAGSLAGAVGSRYVGIRALLAVFGVMCLMALILMFLPPPPEPWGAAGGEVDFDRKAAVLYPAAIGILSGLVGAGGSFLLMPVLVGVMRIPFRLSIGTSLAIVGVSAVTGFFGKLVTGQVLLWPTVAVIAGGVPGVVAGAWLSRHVPTGALRVCLGVLIALATLRVWADVLFH
jgi:uncharacterized membrane protein YfcA